MIALVDIHQQCSGRWSGVLTAIGLPRQAFTGKHGDCLVCGDDRKNARWNPKKEYWVCSKCGVTQAMELALKFTGESFRQTAARIRGERIETMEPIKPDDKQFTKHYQDLLNNRWPLPTLQSAAFRFCQKRIVTKAQAFLITRTEQNKGHSPRYVHLSETSAARFAVITLPIYQTIAKQKEPLNRQKKYFHHYSRLPVVLSNCLSQKPEF
jgi:ribosomal protein S14